MHIHRIDLNLFKVFEAVLREGGITSAARSLNLSQPAVSHALRRLREHLDDPLFQRQGQTMVPTPLARSLAGPIRDALGGLEKTIRELDRFDPGTARRRFTVAMRAPLEEQLAPLLTVRLCTEAPGVDLTSTPVDWHDLRSALADGTLDLAIDVGRSLDSTIHRRLLRADRFVVLARPGHPALRQGRIPLEDYLAAEHIRVSLRRQRPGLEDQELARRGLSRRIRLRCQHHTAACRIVRQTDLLLTMPGTYARIFNEAFGNVVCPMPIEVTPMETYLYWHADAESDPAGRWLRQLIVEEVSSVAGS
ncbi:MAG: hypothetical protein RIS35_3548 [Pseudomonadota bacterium]